MNKQFLTLIVTTLFVGALVAQPHPESDAYEYEYDVPSGYTIEYDYDHDAPRDGAYDELTVAEKGVLPYDHIREADVFWKKRIWREVYVSEKKNLSWKYPKEFFVNILRDNAIEGTITVYDGMDDEFTRPLSRDEVKKLGVGEVDTIWVPNVYTGVEEPMVTNPQFDPSKVKKFRIKEDWIFDEETSTMVVRIIGIAPIMEVVDDQGNVRGDQVLFWVHYPTARPMLSMYKYYNPGSDASTLSWEDILELRYFSSIVIKESNVYDRRVQDYAVGTDAVQESDRIIEEMFEFEQSLWSY